MALGPVELEGVQLLWRNFVGREEKYNREGDRNFTVILDNETAQRLLREGWNVKTKPPREEGDEPFNYLSVSVSYKGRTPPRVVLVSSKNRNTLSEDLLELADWAEIDHCDIIIRPYEWNVSGKSGVKAYLKIAYIVMYESKFDEKYAHLPEIGQDRFALPGGDETLALPAGDDPDIIDGEVISDEEDPWPVFGNTMKELTR